MSPTTKRKPKRKPKPRTGHPNPRPKPKPRPKKRAPAVVPPAACSSAFSSDAWGPTVEVLAGDCVEVMKSFPPASFDAVVVDPPYGLEFMGKDWDRLESPIGRTDLRHHSRKNPELRQGMGVGVKLGAPKRNPWCRKCGKLRFARLPCVCESPEWDTRTAEGGRQQQAFHERWALEAYRVLKPGGYLLAFGGSRTYHRMAAGVEDAGFEIRDQLMWLYGSGFPKSLDVAKAIDKKRDDRADVLKVTAWFAEARDAAGIKNGAIDEAFGFHGMAGHWTSVKKQPIVPSLEQVPKLLEVLGSPEVPAEVAELLVVLNGRKGTPGEAWFRREVVGRRRAIDTTKARIAPIAAQGLDRTPTRTIDITRPASDEARAAEGLGTGLKPAHEPIVLARRPLSGTVAKTVAEFGTGALNIEACRVGSESTQSSGTAEMGYPGGNKPGRYKTGSASGRWPTNVIMDGDAGEFLDRQTFSGVSRFFYCPKATRKEREAGCLGLSKRQRHEGRKVGRPGGSNPRNRRVQGRLNHHPTVKPIALMRYLIRLVTPEGGRVLDPFLGSGTTLLAAALEARGGVGIERDAEYVELAVTRVGALLKCSRDTFIGGG